MPPHPYRTSLPRKNVLSRLSVALVSTMPRRISRRSSGRQGRLDGGATQRTIAGIDDLGIGLIEPRLCGCAGCGVAETSRRGRSRLKAAAQLLSKRGSQRIDAMFVGRHAPTRHGFERLERVGERQRMPLRDERAKTAREPGRFLQLGDLRI